MGHTRNEMSVLHLDYGCYTLGTVSHELLHVLGAHHEQTRPDRDEHVEVKWDNVGKDCRHNYIRSGNRMIQTRLPQTRLPRTWLAQI